jgi:hypothetical protein
VGLRYVFDPEQRSVLGIAVGAIVGAPFHLIALPFHRGGEKPGEDAAEPPYKVPEDYTPPPQDPPFRFPTDRE